MEIRQGYKYTEEFGYIPDDWEVKKIGDVGETIIGLTYSPKEISKIGILVLRSSNIQNDKLSFQDNLFVKKELPQKLYTRYGDILVCVRNGSRELIGKCAFIDERCVNQTFGAFMTVLRTVACPYFIFSMFQSSIIKEQIKDGIGATINQITNYLMRNFIFPLPPIQEQEKIAQVLRDMDKLIESTERLLEKKRNLKTAAMQKLLTPQSHWEEMKIKDCCPLQRGFDLPIDKIKLGCFPVVFSNGIGKFHDMYKVKGPGVVTGRSGSIGGVFYINEDFWPHNTTLWVTKFINCFPLYIYYVLKWLKLEKYKGGSGVPTLNRNDLHEKILFFPPLQEQQQIAQILSDMDEEIEALEKELEKYRMIKTGAMQELLTGKTRLV